jgi:hypothetical protein
MKRKRCAATHKYTLFIYIFFNNLSVQNRLNKMLALKSFLYAMLHELPGRSPKKN